MGVLSQKLLSISERPPGLLMPDDRAIHCMTTRGYVIDVQRDDVTAAELTADGQVEESEAALS